MRHVSYFSGDSLEFILALFDDYLFLIAKDFPTRGADSDVERLLKVSPLDEDATRELPCDLQSAPLF